MTRVLVTGAGGLLGAAVVAALEGVEVLTPGFDVTDRDATVGVLTALRPDVVVHLAAWTAVDECEADPARALAVNALGTRHVADGVRRTGAHGLYVSTDYVFDGAKAAAYDEWDRPNPISAYGRSKHGGELELDPGWAVVRTSWLLAARSGFVPAILRAARAGEELRVVDDQRGCPTAVGDLGPAIARLALARLPGTFHVTNQGATTWYELARAVVGLAGHDPARVVPISSLELGRPARRPANSVLDNAALRMSGIPLLRDHHDPLEQLVKELVAP